MRSELPGECFYQFVGAVGYKFTSRNTQGGVVDGAADVVSQFVELRSGPNGHRYGYPLRGVPFVLSNAKASKDLELLDMNGIKAIRVHRVSSDTPVNFRNLA